jgi:hypothetical protein
MVQAAALISGKIGLDNVTRRGCNHSYATLELHHTGDGSRKLNYRRQMNSALDGALPAGR